ncbi:MAG: EcsC family protein [Chitinophagaceae bacterium]|nr:EcsC family protein [Chitinophagaceae bacterium]
MDAYELKALRELKQWQKDMSANPSWINRLSKRVQTRINSYIPQKVHGAITATIKQMVRGVLFGATHTTFRKPAQRDLVFAEAAVKNKINIYKTTAATEGGITGAGGFLMAMADFPLLLGIKIKLLFEIATEYGFSVREYKERLFILHVMQLAFSSQENRKLVYRQIADWDEKSKLLPEDIKDFDWQSFQQEYRDYIDLAKLAQLIPGIGAVVGVAVNYRLINQLGKTAMNAYRMRLYETRKIT